MKKNKNSFSFQESKQRKVYIYFDKKLNETNNPELD